MEFKLKANVTFESDDLNDAFIQLAQHMCSMYLGTKSSVFTEGYIDVRPVEEGDGDVD